ncbi:MAG: glycosyltransferase family 4 protein [Bacteroidota bacterium]|nr:glycosyltransferase family 4 protein [Bacteroidota bacterium]
MNSDKLKVLLVPADFYHAEGNIALNLKESCHEIEFFLFAAHDIPKRFEEFIGLLKKVDVVHFLMNLCNINFPRDLDKDEFFKNLPCASVSTVHHICQGEEIKLYEAQKLDMIHVVSKEWQEIIKDNYNQDTFLAQLGVDKKKFNKNIRTRPGSPFKIGMFGFFVEYKNRKRLDVFINALALLKGKNFDFEVILQGQLHPNIKAELVRNNIPYKYYGILDSENAFQAYKKVDCYVITADVEGGPFSTLEALASGVPLITTAVGMSKEVIKNGINGIVIEKNNPKLLCDSIYKLGTDQDFYNKLVKEGLNDVKEYDWRNIGKKYTQLYRETFKVKAQHSKPTKVVSGFNITLKNKEVLQRDLLRESAFLYKYNNYRGSAKLFIRSLMSGYADLGVYKEYLKKIIYKA